jgi:hypothetical protein
MDAQNLTSNIADVMTDTNSDSTTKEERKVYV